MKKIISILIVALVALAFMGCPTTYDDLSWGGPAVGDVIGDMSKDGLALTQSADDPTIYTTEEFTYKNDMSAWGGKDGTVNCKVRAVAGDWGGGDYASGSTPTIGGDYASLDGSNNITITGFKADSVYVFYIKTTRDTGVMMKVVEIKKE